MSPRLSCNDASLPLLHVPWLQSKEKRKGLQVSGLNSILLILICTTTIRSATWICYNSLLGMFCSTECQM